MPVPLQGLGVSSGVADGQVVLLPPLNPDVALIHAQYVGDDGPCRINGLTFADIEQAKAAGAMGMVGGQADDLAADADDRVE